MSLHTSTIYTTLRPVLNGVYTIRRLSIMSFYIYLILVYTGLLVRFLLDVFKL
jgi:hypothetical protein